MENDKPNNPDKRIRAKLDSGELKPDAALWNEIERELDKTKRRGIFFRKRYLLLLLLLFGGIGVLTIQFNRDNLDTKQTNSNDRNKTQDQSSSNSTNHQGISTQDAATTSTRADYETLNNQTQQQEKTITGNRHDTNSPNNDFAAARPVEQNIQSNNNARAETSDNATVAQQRVNTIDKTNENDATQQQEATAHHQPESTSTNHTTDDNDHVTNSNETDLNRNNETIAAAEINRESIHQGVEAIEQDSISSTEPIAIITQDTFQVSADSTANTIAALDSSLKISDDDKLSKPIKEKPAVQFFAGPYVQYNSVSKTIATNRNVPEQYLQRRNAEEKKTTALSYGLKVGVDVNRFAFQSGIGVRSYADDLQYDNRKLCYDIVRIGSIATPQYDTISVHSEASDIVGTQNGKSTNRYLEMPLLVGYRICNGAFFLRPVVGVAFAVPLSWQSNYLDETVTGLVDPKSSDWLKPVVFNLVGELTASRQLAKNTFVNFGLNYNRNLSNIFKQSAGVSQRYASWGGHLGLTFGF